MKKVLKNILPPRLFFSIRRKLKNHFDEISVINDFLNFEKGLMLDVGSLNGFSFLPFLLRNWEIYAFEPDQNNYENIRKYLNRWGLKANLIKNAVSDIEETRTFYTSTASRGIPSLLKFDKNQVPSYKVQTITLKKFVESNGINFIDFLKIDVEGYDFMVLKGFDFKILKPRVIMCEFEDKKTELLDYSIHDMANFLVEKGYYLVYSIWFPIKEYGVQHDWKKFSTDIAEVEPEDWGNIIGFANEKDYNDFRRKHKI